MSFLELIACYGRVEIPLVQRDYAQGRDSAEAVRGRFLAHLLRALSEDEPLSLDFVYGEVAGEHGFQPIDGQQRLTTLFLLHWFLACAADRAAEFRKAMRDEHGEPRFRYAIRTSSRRFFSGLLDHAPQTLTGPPSADIRECAWFFRAWDHDPTIRGALTMLDAIQKQFVGASGLEGFYARLARTDRASITMDVLSLGELGLSDEIYVKMNARGKELTGFERFKAWLIETHASLRWPSGNDEAKQWTVLLDSDWLDLFWRCHHERPDPAEAVSRVYFRTVVALAVNSRLSGDDKLKPGWLEADKADQEERWKDLFTASGVEGVLEKLRVLSTGGRAGDWPVTRLRERLAAAQVGPFGGKWLDRAFFEDPAVAVTYEMRLWLHALCVFLGSGLPQGGTDETEWFRVVRNLLQNRHDISDTDFGNAIRDLDALGQSAVAAGSVFRAVADARRVTGLGDRQWAEEQRKLRLMRQPETSARWKELILAAEAHPILTGQIEGLLPEQDDAVEKFRLRWEVFGRLWDEHGSRLAKDEMLLARAVLAHSTPIKLGSQERIFLDDQASRWSESLSRGYGRAHQWEQFRQGALALIDSLIGEEEPEFAIRRTLATKQVAEPWMQDIVQYGADLLGASWKKKVQQYYGDGVFVFAGDNWTEQAILLGPTARLRSLLAEGLTAGEQTSWGMEADWRRMPVGQALEAVFYKGYVLTIVRRNDADGDRAVCTMGYHKVGISLDKDPGSKVEIPYPADRNLSTFLQSLDDKIAAAPAEMKTVLLELKAAGCFTFG